MSAKWLTVSVVALSCSAISIGCGGKVERPAMGRVHGTVTFDGKPVDKGRVTFTPVSGDGISGGTSAMSPIESDGTYNLTTFDTGDGAIVGQHIVTVIVPTEDIVALNKPRADGSIPYILPKELIPKKYTDPKQTPLRNTVVAGDNTLNIDLKK
jgi:hypothetical protein